jgi:flavin-dependent dehydrogenase
MTPSIMTDVVVVGGGPTGLAAAIMARLAGMSVIVFEPKTMPIDKACGEGLMPPALLVLEKIGVDKLEGHRFLGVRYVEGDRVAQAEFSMGPGLGVRRTVLHDALTRRALDLGVQIRPTRVRTWSQNQTGVVVEGEPARWLLAADGLHSPIRKALGLQAKARHPPRLGIRRHFSVQPWSDFVEIHWHRDAEAYVTPISEDTVGVAILYGSEATATGEGEPWDRWLSTFPALQSRLGEPCSKPRGAGPFEQRVSSQTHGRVLLIGDAAGYVDPLTGEGVRLGLDSAQAAIDAISQCSEAHYSKKWRALTRRYRWLTGGLLFIRRHEPLRTRLLPLLERWPKLFRVALDALNHC